MAFDASLGLHWRLPRLSTYTVRMSRLSRMVCRPLRGAVFAATLASCTPDAPLPILSQVEPSWAYSGAEASIVVTGENLMPLLAAEGASDIAVDDRFHLFLETDPTTPLLSVERWSNQRVSAVVPAGLPSGRYDLVLATPAGDRARLSQAFTVTDSRASRISVSSTAARVDVRSDALVNLQLVDPSGLPVPSAIPVVVEAVSALGDPSAIVFRGGLVDQTTVSPGVIAGTLDDAGGASLYVSSAVVDQLTVRVEGTGLSSHLAGESEPIRFEPRGVGDVWIDVPEGPLLAGQPFSLHLTLLDSDGNPTYGELMSVVLSETCTQSSESYLQVVTVQDQQQVDNVVLTGATVPGGCEENRIRVVGLASGEPLVAETAPLDILAGPVAEYSLTLSQDTVVAGTGAQVVVVRATDALQNPVSEHSASLVWQDSVGGLSTEESIGSAACLPFSGGMAICTLQLVRAGSNVTVQVQDSTGIEGTSDAFAVVAGPASQGILLPGTLEAVAGEPLDITLQVLDAFGNAASLLAADGGAAAILSDSTGTLVCADRRPHPLDGIIKWSCAILKAEQNVVLSAALTEPGFEVASAPVRVDNADIARADIVLREPSVVAGDALAYTVETYDAYGNPYIVQSASSLQIDDEGGELRGTVLTLGPDGTATGEVSLFVATAANRLVGRVFGRTLGVSDVFSVEPGPHSGYSVVLDSTWVDLDQEAPVRIVASDAYGNQVPSVNTQVTLASVADDSGETLVEVVDGEGVYDWSWPTTVLQDQLRVTDGRLEGESAPVDVVEFDCANGPAAGFLVDGLDAQVLCMTASRTATVTMDASTSVVGAAPLVAFHNHDGDGAWSRSTVETWSEQWRSVGGWLPEVVVVDQNGCADRSSVTVWVGVSDGQPVGPVDVLVDSTELVVGSVSLGTTDVTLRASDCAGDPASGGTLYVRADRGVVGTGADPVLPTGYGLQVSLDSDGEASVAWSVTAALEGGPSSVVAGVPSGAAFGSATVDVDGDSARPWVVGVDPDGPFMGAETSFTVWFSEAMYVPSLLTTAFWWTAPDGRTVEAASLVVGDDGRTVTVEPTEPVVGTSGEWVFSIGSTVRDAGGGNRLDGAEVGVASDAVFSMGGVAANPNEVQQCAPSSAVFRPDGDDGVGEERDEAEIAVVAVDVPTAWWLGVWGSDDTLEIGRMYAATRSAETLVWDGRDAAGRVVDNGPYWLEVVALDEKRVRSGSCFAEVTVAQNVRAPEVP